MFKACVGLVSVLALAAVSCGGKTAGETVRPADPTIAGARGEPGEPAVCHEVSAEGTPLVVDWLPEERGDLEAAMKGGNIAVVHYDCKTVKLLPDCKVEGQYAYLGITKKEQLISIENADQAQANLPLHGVSLGGGMSRGSTIDVGLIMVGKKSTPIDGVDKGRLGPHCEGATHYVQSATVGAFAVKTSTAGEAHAKAAVDLFGGIGASGSSSSKKDSGQKDGEPSACNGADVDAPKAPNNCGAPLRVRLVALADKPGDHAPKDEGKDVICAPGTIPSKGKCIAEPKKDAAKPATADGPCQMGDTPAHCEKACEKGDPESCSLASLNYRLGMDVKQDDAKTTYFSGKACELGDQRECWSYADDIKQKDPARAVTMFAKSCDAGIPMACASYGDFYSKGAKADPAKALRGYLRACNGGYPAVCNNVARTLEKGGPGLPADSAKRATEIYAMLCHPGDSLGEACYKAGLGYEKDEPAKAKKFLKTACETTKGGYPIACTELKKLK